MFGQAFCALIHQYQSNLIDFNSLTQTDAKRNLELAFDTAEKNFGCPRLLDVEDILDERKLDERCIITYLAELFGKLNSPTSKKIDLLSISGGLAKVPKNKMNIFISEYKTLGVSREVIEEVARSISPKMTPKNEMSKEALICLIRNSVIGNEEGFTGPFGVRRMTYCDFTASGKALSFIENFIRDEVLPFYANTHTSSSYTGEKFVLFFLIGRQKLISVLYRKTNNSFSRRISWFD